MTPIDMPEVALHPIALADKAALATLQSEAFDEYERSTLLAEVLSAEAAAVPEGTPRIVPSVFGVCAMRGDALVGWSQGYRQGKNEFYMLNSGVTPSCRRQGVYSKLVEAVLAHARTEGYSKVTSKHAASNSAVIIAKMKMDFQITGFEYSEVYGPLVQLTYFVNQARKRLYNFRAAPLRAP